MSKVIEKIFNFEKKHINRIRKIAKAVLEMNSNIQKLSDNELKNKTAEFKDRLAKGETLDDISVEAFAVAREAAKRVIKQHPYEVQIMGAAVLQEGDVAEMRTGEGKTLTSTMAIYLNALSGEGVHVITVNEYLADRDAKWMGEIFKFLGLTVGINTREKNKTQKREAYNCDITYSTNAEIGFDYLRDNMVQSLDERVQRGLNCAIIDEADSILIDESRTPLIISGGKKNTAKLYEMAAHFASKLKPEQYEINETDKVVKLTDKGVTTAEKMFGVKNLYDLEHSTLIHFIHQALRAHYIMKKDFDYVVHEDEIVIVDSFTGRMLKGRTYSDGLHQAIEAKEKVKINEETSVLATITYQNLFRLYNKLSGMTGTAKTEEEEFRDIYNMRVVTIPTNKEVIRVDAIDKIFAKEEHKYAALVEDVAARHTKGQPILVGTIAVEQSEVISNLLKTKGLKHEVLNAKNHAREAEIIAKAGQKGAITIATNMAGRGTDIKLGEGVKELGGLAVLGSERHESRRIDNQLRGRSGRQGDPGYSCFYISLEDELMRRFGGERTKRWISSSLDDRPLESKLISRSISGAQSQIEGSNFDARKNTLKYDDVLREQREKIYQQRTEILKQQNIHDMILGVYKKTADVLVNKALEVRDKEQKVNFERFIQLVENEYLPPNSLNSSELKYLTIDDTKNHLYNLMVNNFEQKVAAWDQKIVPLIEGSILIRTLDSNWTRHIDAMAKLRDGIGLRSYANTDPLNHYVNEGYTAFNKMLDQIALDTVHFLDKAEIQIKKVDPVEDVIISEGGR